jgi:hypothetical protein
VAAAAHRAAILAERQAHFKKSAQPLPDYAVSGLNVQGAAALGGASSNAAGPL